MSKAARLKNRKKHVVVGHRRMALFTPQGVFRNQGWVYRCECGHKPEVFFVTSNEASEAHTSHTKLYI